MKRSWTFYVQLLALCGFSVFAVSVSCWFVWRALQLRDLHYMWQPAVAIGVVEAPLFLVFAGILWKLFLTVAVPGRPADAPQAELRPAERVLLAPIMDRPNPRIIMTVCVLLAVSLWGFFAWGWQLYHGLTVTGMGSPVFWGFYITNFVFFIGISHAGTLISAILRIANAEWRRAITRSAEVITVLVILFGAGNIILDLGRPDRMLNVFFNGRLQSPLLWDVCSITGYITGSTIYLYLPLIPDIAILRDHVHDWRHGLYDLLSLGWTGTPAQVHVLESSIAIMALIVIPVAISVHTVVSYVFSMTIQPMWHSSIFGPYFVVGAIFSGIAALIIAMAILRWAYGLNDYLRPIHFQNLGALMLVMSCLWLYFTGCEFLTTWYGAGPDEMGIFWSKISGHYAPYFWTMVATCFIIPFSVLVSPLRKTVAWTVIASIPVCIGMWLERFLIVVPTLVRPRLPFAGGHYSPSWVEVSLFAACIAGFALLYVLFTRFFPIVSIWEVREGQEHAVDEVSKRVASYLPSAEAGEAFKAAAVRHVL